MKILDENFDFNGNDYKLIKRTKLVGLYSINDGRRYEVCRIYIKRKSYDPYWWSHAPEQELISANGRFAKDGSKLFNNLEGAMAYFEKLSQELQDKGGEDIYIW
jgi:hypothetical protein